MEYNCVTCLDRLICAGYNMIDTYRVADGLTNLRFQKGTGEVVAYTGSSASSSGIIMYCTIPGDDSYIHVGATYSTGDSAIYENVDTGKFLEIVCKHPETEWMELFAAYDLERKLEVLDG